MSQEGSSRSCRNASKASSVKPAFAYDITEALFIADWFSSQAEPVPQGILDQSHLTCRKDSELSSEFRFRCRCWVLSIEDTEFQEWHINRDLESSPPGTRGVGDYRRERPIRVPRLDAQDDARAMLGDVPEVNHPDLAPLRTGHRPPLGHHIRGTTRPRVGRSSRRPTADYPCPALGGGFRRLPHAAPALSVDQKRR